MDLRSLKAVLQMDSLRCQSEALVRTAVWAHVLADNLIGTVLAQTAQEHGVLPLERSFKAALPTLAAFAGLLLGAAAEPWAALCRRVREVVARHRVGQRPDRYEPRAKRRRVNPNPPPVTEARQKARARLAAKR